MNQGGQSLLSTFSVKCLVLNTALITIERKTTNTGFRTTILKIISPKNFPNRHVICKGSQWVMWLSNNSLYRAICRLKQGGWIGWRPTEQLRASWILEHAASSLSAFNTWGRSGERGWIEGGRICLIPNITIMVKKGHYSLSLVAALDQETSRVYRVLDYSALSLPKAADSSQLQEITIPLALLRASPDKTSYPWCNHIAKYIM